MGIDPFYTSTALASDLVSYIRKAGVTTVADFCVGGGELLRAVLNRWPNINCFGTDISANTIDRLKIDHPNWTLGKCDFLDCKSREQLIDKARFDLVVLNPPFSCKGSTIINIELDGKYFRASTAMAFVAESLKYLSKEGVLYAILPISVAYSQKDKEIWNYLIDNYNLNILEERDKQSFKNCAPSIILISLKDKNRKTIPTTVFRQISIDIPVTSIKRGNVSIYEANKFCGDTNFIHTTNLIDNNIVPPFLKINKESSTVSGPAVIFPRVCNPNKHKICIIPTDKKYVLSDCIIAINVSTDSHATQLQKGLLDNWEAFKLLYQGTGAKYITIDRIKTYLDFKPAWGECGENKESKNR